MHVLLGRAAGITDEKLAHLGDDPLPQALFADDERAIVRYAQRSTRMQPIDDALYAELAAHFDAQQIIEICFVVGLSNLVNRFHATFLTDRDSWVADAIGESCPLPYPTPTPTSDAGEGGVQGASVNSAASRSIGSSPGAP